MKFKTILFLIIFFITANVFAQYSGGSGSGYGAGASNVVGVSAFLQGPFSGGTMTTALNTNNFIPLAQPYTGTPWNYTGSESVAAGFFSTHTDIVDWVLVELRTGTAASTTVHKRACFIKNNGNIVDLDGTNPVKFDKTNNNSFYVVIRHRNHLAVMSANPLTLSSSLSGTYLTGGSTTYNFSTAQSTAYGFDAMKSLGGGFYGMYAADGNKDGGIYAEDYILYRTSQGNEDYLFEDYNLDGGVYAEDYILYRINQGAETYVP